MLLTSLNRKLTAMAVWLRNWLLDATTGAEKNRLLANLHRLRTHPRADTQAQAAAKGFYRFQTKEA